MGKIQGVSSRHLLLKLFPKCAEWHADLDGVLFG